MSVPTRDGGWLVFNETYTTDRRRDAMKKDIMHYFDLLGYRQTQTTPTLQYERGMALASWYNFNPASYRTQVTVDIFNTNEGAIIVEVMMRAYTVGSILLEKDYDYFEAQLSGLGDAIYHSRVDDTHSLYAAERATWYSIGLMLIIFLVVGGVVAFALFSALSATAI